MKRFIKSRKGMTLLATLVAAAAAAAAWAYFTGNASGSGQAQTAQPVNLTIKQIGAGYDSLIPNNGYSQDQCFQCAQISAFGNDVTLAKPASLQRLTSAVVAFRN